MCVNNLTIDMKEDFSEWWLYWAVFSWLKFKMYLIYSGNSNHSIQSLIYVNV